MSMAHAEFFIAGILGMILGFVVISPLYSFFTGFGMPAWQSFFIALVPFLFGIALTVIAFTGRAKDYG